MIERYSKNKPSHSCVYTRTHIYTRNGLHTYDEAGNHAIFSFFLFQLHVQNRCKQHTVHTITIIQYTIRNAVCTLCVYALFKRAIIAE